jgi:hypothetical protein
MLCVVLFLFKKWQGSFAEVGLRPALRGCAYISLDALRCVGLEFGFVSLLSFLLLPGYWQQRDMRSLWMPLPLRSAVSVFFTMGEILLDL